MTDQAEHPTRVRSYQPGDEHAIHALFERCFPDATRSLDGWRWRFVDAPEPSHLLMVDDPATGDLLCHAALERGRFWIDGSEWLVALGGDFMVRPEFRGHRIADQMTSTFRPLWMGADAALGFPGEKSAHIGMRTDAIRWLLGAMPQWLWWGSAEAARCDRPSLPPPAASAVALGCRALLTANRSRHIHFDDVVSLEPASEVACEFDRLDERFSHIARCVRRRDAQHLRWRWLEQPDRSWTLSAARDGRGQLTGYVVFGPLGATGRIVDLVAFDPETQSSLVARALRALAAGGCDRITLELLDPRPWSKRSLRRLGMWCRGEGPTIAIGVARKPVRDAFTNRASWYLTIGDSDHV